jgi:hypothetical protein
MVAKGEDTTKIDEDLAEAKNDGIDDAGGDRQSSQRKLFEGELTHRLGEAGRGDQKRERESGAASSTSADKRLQVFLGADPDLGAVPVAAFHPSAQVQAGVSRFTTTWCS